MGKDVRKDLTTRDLGRALGRKIARLERHVRELEVASQGAFRSVEDGAIDFYDDDDVLRERVGKQKDGSYGRLTIDGPVPPTPSEPDVVVIDNGVVAITWDGRCDEKWPFAEFRNVRVHLGDTATFTPTRNNQVGTIHAHRGGTIVAVTESDDDNPVWVRLVAVSTAGHTSDPSVAVLVDELDEDDLEDQPEELQWEDGDGHTLTQADIDAGTVTFGLSHFPEQESVLAWWRTTPQARGTDFTVDVEAPSVTWPLSGFEKVGDRLRVYYPYYDGGDGAVFVVATTSAQSTSSGTSLTVPISSTVEAGDLLLLGIARQDDTAPGAGWTLVESLHHDVGSTKVYSRIADGSETSVTLTGTADFMAGICVVVRGGTTTAVTTSVEAPADATFTSPAAASGNAIAFAVADGGLTGPDYISAVTGTVLANLNVGSGRFGLAATDGDATFTAANITTNAYWVGITVGVS